MNRILQLSSFIAFIFAMAACTKDEPTHQAIEINELLGHWVRIPDSGLVDTSMLTEYKQLVFHNDGRVQVINGKFCNFESSGEAGETTFEYYTESGGHFPDGQKLIKFESCGGGMPVRIQDSTMTLGYSGNASEQYQLLPDTPETPEDPDDPENPGDPDDPENPGDPDDPDNSGDPDDPDNSGDPDDPDNSGDPDDPNNSGDPDNPNNSGA